MGAARIAAARQHAVRDVLRREGFKSLADRFTRPNSVRTGRALAEKLADNVVHNFAAPVQAANCARVVAPFAQSDRVDGTVLVSSGNTPGSV
jgi:hypothetical protein